MLKLYHQISRNYPFINKSDLVRPTSLINKFANTTATTNINNTRRPFQNTPKKPIDILIIDEAHLLATCRDSFKKFHQNNHLEELFKLCKVVILSFDENQSLRMGSFWSLNEPNNGASLVSFLNSDKYVHRFEIFKLTKQQRLRCSADLLNWIKELTTTKRILKPPIADLQKSYSYSLSSLSSSLSSLSSLQQPSFDFKIFRSCSMMYDFIKHKNSKLTNCRILSTYDFPFRLDGQDYYVSSQSDDFRLRWDRYLPSNGVPWNERPDTINEVGSVYAIQGFELNYAGIILGRSVGYDRRADRIAVRPELYDDHAGFIEKQNISDAMAVREKIVLNSIYVLLTRGVLGLYLFAWDNDLRERLIRGADPRLVV